MVEVESVAVLERGDPAPSFSLPGADGESYSIDDFMDMEALLLVFTCNHCPYAKAKFDELNRLAAEFEEVAVVGINPNDAEEYPEDDFQTMEELVAEGTIQFDAYLRDEAQDVAAAYGAMCTPDPFLFENTSREGETVVDGDGGFHLAYHGRLDDAPDPDGSPSEREMRTYIQSLLAGNSIPTEYIPSRGCSIKWKQGNEPEYWQ